MTRPVHPATFGWCMDPSHRRGDCTCPCHTPADPGADECRGDAAGEFERDLSEYGVEL